MPKTHSVSHQLRRAVAASGKSRYRISKDLKVSEATMSRFMHGTRGLSQDLMDRLCAYLGLDLCEKATGGGR
jgi:plasmid maintenance system antidote protein VapI